MNQNLIQLTYYLKQRYIWGAFIRQSTLYVNIVRISFKRLRKLFLIASRFEDLANSQQTR